MVLCASVCNVLVYWAKLNIVSLPGRSYFKVKGGGGGESGGGRFLRNFVNLSFLGSQINDVTKKEWLVTLLHVASMKETRNGLWILEHQDGECRNGL
jgi:hypothetical protein